MSEKYSDELLSLFKSLLCSPFCPVADGSPVLVSRKHVVNGLGSFAIRKYASYEGRNYQTGTIEKVPERLVVDFKADPNLIKAIEKSTGENTKALSFTETTLENALDRVRESLFGGCLEVDLPGVGVFKIATQEKPGLGKKTFVRFRSDDALEMRLQGLLS